MLNDDRAKYKVPLIVLQLVFLPLLFVNMADGVYPTSREKCGEVPNIPGMGKAMVVQWR